MPWVFFPDRPGGALPAVLWPKALSSAAYAKIDKKAKVAEMASSLSTAERLFNGVAGKIPGAPSRANHDKANNYLRDMQGFLNGGDTKKLVGALKILSARASAGITDKKKLGLDSKIVSALQDIKSEADDCAASFNTKKLIPKLGTLGKALIEADRQTVLARMAPTIRAFKSCAQRGHPEIAVAAQALRDWDDGSDDTAKERVRSAVFAQLYDTCRDMSQNTGNLVKVLKAGGEVPGIEARDVTTLPKLTTSLARIGNAKSPGAVVGGLDKAGLTKLIRTVQVNAQLYDQISGRLPS